jgi:signal transduction histidine kinase
MRSFLLILFVVFSIMGCSQSVEQMVDRVKDFKNGSELTKLYTDIGSKYYYKGDFKNALKYYFLALDSAQKIKELRHLGVAYHGIGSVYLETSKLDDALSYFKKAESLMTETGDHINLGRVFLSIGNIYYMKEQDSLCEVYYNKSLDIGHRINDSINLVDGYNNLGALYFEMGNRSDTLKAAEAFKKATSFIRANDTVKLFESYLGLAELYTYSGYLSEGKIYLDQCAALIGSIRAIQTLDDYYYCLHHFYKEMGDFKASLLAYQKYKTFQDSIINSENNKQLAELNVKYQTEQKEKQIELLNAQKETQRLVLIIILLVLSILIFLAYFLFNRYKRNEETKKERELQTQKEAERIRIARDMHDEIGAGLTRIVMRSEQGKQQLLAGEGQQSIISESFSKMTTEARELSRNIGEIIWSLNPKNDTLDTLFAYIRSYAYDYLENANISCVVNFPDTIPDVVFSPEMRRNIFLIVKESLNNIVKHSQATQVEITLTLGEKQFTLSIKDNGKGITAKKEDGNGLGNMKKRTEESGGTFIIEDNPGGGTIVSIENIPIRKNPTKV